MNQRKRMRQRVVAGLNNPFVMLPATRRPELLHLMGEEKDEIDCKIDLKKNNKILSPSLDVASQLVRMSLTGLIAG